MAMGGIARVSQVQLLQPFVTFALAALFNGETITLQILLFAAAVVATVAISTRTSATPAGARTIRADSGTRCHGAGPRSDVALHSYSAAEMRPNSVACRSNSPR